MQPKSVKAPPLAAHRKRLRTPLSGAFGGWDGVPFAIIDLTEANPVFPMRSIDFRHFLSVVSNFFRPCTAVVKSWLVNLSVATVAISLFDAKSEGLFIEAEDVRIFVSRR